MIRLYTIKDISSFSSDSVFKICLALEKYGLSEENIEDFGTYTEIFAEAISSLEKGNHVVIAVENADYISTKKELFSKLILDGKMSKVIREAITLNAGDDVSEIDMGGHCLVPENSLCHLTTDGLYSGFTCKTISGKLTYIPLDFMRLDEVLTSIADSEEAEARAAEHQPETTVEGFTSAEDFKSNDDFKTVEKEEHHMPAYDFSPAVEKMVSSLYRLDKKVALTTSEATMWIYNLYDKIDNLTETINFIEINDPETDKESEDEAKFEDSIQDSRTPEEIQESESMRIIRHAREAMYNTDCNFGAAISKVYTSTNENGQDVYYAYVAVVDRSTAKAKKINTLNPDDLPLILPHAVTILSEVVCQKADVIQTAIARINYTEQEEEEEQKEAPAQSKGSGLITLSKGMIAFAVVVFLFSLISPVLMTYIMLKPQTTTTAPTVPPSVQQPQNNYVTQDVYVPSTTQNPFITTAPTTMTPVYNAGVTESTAPEVSAVPTTTPIASESGVFTFHVFGYGHGVGMSQVGANYLATQGWQAAEILAHYYYDAQAATKIVVGDTYPATIKYSGTDYATREYLASALESEMGGSFQVEALKAQAIAIYTFAKYNNYNLSSDAHAFGKTPSQTVYAVVDDVIAGGYYIANGNDVAVTPFHAMSAGVTTSYYNVWGKGIGTTVSYLSGGRKSYGDYLDTNYKSVYTITSADLKALVKQNAGIELTGDPSTWVSIITHDSAVREDIGYISSINVGGTIMTGNDFRIKVMGGRIRSHCFALTYTPNAQ